MTQPPQDKGAIRETIDTLNDFWFGFGSATALGLFRAVFGTLACLNFLNLSQMWESWFSERGFVPAWLGQRFLWPQVNLVWLPVEVPRMGLLNGVTDDRISLLVFVITFVAAIFTALGLLTRVSTVTLAVGIVSLHHRDAAILHGGDTVLRVMSLYLAIAPSGAACSLDRLISLWKGKTSTAITQVSMWPQRLIAYNCALLYLTTTWLKWGGHLWQNGTANWYPARLQEFHRFPVPAFLTNTPTIYFTTYLTLIVEFALGTLVFYRPLRGWILFSGLLLHGYIEYSMNIPLFSYLMVSMYISFYDGEEIAAWAKRRGAKLNRFKLTVALPKGQKLTQSAGAFLATIDPFCLVSYVQGDSPEWSAQNHSGKTVPVWRSICGRALGCWIFGWFPGFWSRFEMKALEPISG